MNIFSLEQSIIFLSHILGLLLKLLLFSHLWDGFKTKFIFFIKQLFLSFKSEFSSVESIIQYPPSSHSIAFCDKGILLFIFCSVFINSFLLLHLFQIFVLFLASFYKIFKGSNLDVRKISIYLMTVHTMWIFNFLLLLKQQQAHTRQKNLFLM